MPQEEHTFEHVGAAFVNFLFSCAAALGYTFLLVFSIHPYRRISCLKEKNIIKLFVPCQLDPVFEEKLMYCTV